MRISRTRSLRVNMGNYGERYEFGASITFDHSDLGYTDEEWVDHVKDVGVDDAYAELLKEVLEALSEQLEEEIEEANELRPEDEESFIGIDDTRQRTRTRRSRRS